MLLSALVAGAAVGLLASLLPAPWSAITLWVLGVIAIGPIVSRWVIAAVTGPQRGVLPFSIYLVIVPKWTRADDVTMLGQWAAVGPSLRSYRPIALHTTPAAPTRRFTCTDPEDRAVTVVTNLGGVGGVEWVAGLLWLTERRGVDGPTRRRLALFRRLAPPLIADGKGWLQAADGSGRVTGGVLADDTRYVIGYEGHDEWLPASTWGLGAWRQRQEFTEERLRALEAARLAAETQGT